MAANARSITAIVLGSYISCRGFSEVIGVPPLQAGARFNLSQPPVPVAVPLLVIIKVCAPPVTVPRPLTTCDAGFTQAISFPRVGFGFAARPCPKLRVAGDRAALPRHGESANTVWRRLPALPPGVENIPPALRQRISYQLALRLQLP